MFLYILSLLLIDEDITADVPTVSADNFYDISLHLDKANDLYKINVAEKTLIFISTIDGYEASVRYNTFNRTETVDFNYQKDRLIYFYYAGYIKIKATVDNLNLDVHSLNLEKLEDHLDYDRIYISSYPSEIFKVLEKSNSPYSNATFGDLDLLFWHINSATTNFQVFARVIQKVQGSTGWRDEEYFNCYLGEAKTDLNDKSTVSMVQVVLTQNFNCKSRLLYIKHLTGFLSFTESKITYKNEPNEGGYENSCINYRSLFYKKTLTRNRVIKRGESHTVGFEQFLLLENGITELDFSIFNKMYPRTQSIIMVFPTISELQTNIFNNISLEAMIYNYQFIFKSGTENYVNEADTRIKIIVYYIGNEHDQMSYIISTSPTEKLIIDENDANYTNDKSYTYIYSSLQDVETTVIYEGDVTFQSIDYGQLIDIEINSEEKISGPFIAKISKNAKVAFQSKLVGDLKDELNNDIRVIFDRQKERNIYYSKKYGSFYNFSTLTSENKISFDKENKYPYFVHSGNLVYAQTTKGWYGKILYPYLEDNNIGFKYDKTSFYVINGNESTIDFMVYPEDDYINNNKDPALYIRSVEVNSPSRSYKCDRMIITNLIPSLYKFNGPKEPLYRTIKTDKAKNICLFTALSSFYTGFENNASKYLYNYDYFSVNENTITDKQLSKYFSAYRRRIDPSLLLFHFHPQSVVGYFGINDINLNETQIGLVDNEEKIYYDFDINLKNGIYSFGKNTVDDIYQGYKYINLDDDNYTVTQTIDMNEIETLEIDCPSYAILDIKQMKGLEIEIYQSPNFNNLYDKIDEDSSKLIKLGSKASKLTIKRRSNSNSKLLSSSNDIFSYSFLNFENVKNKRSFQCKEIFVSNDPNFNFLIKNSILEDDENIYNYTLSATSDLCFWFSFPVNTKLTINFNFSSTHNHYMFYNDRSNLLYSNNIEYKGYNFLYTLRYKKSNEILPGSINISASPIPNSNDPSLENNEVFNKFINYNSNYEIIDLPKESPSISDSGNKPFNPSDSTNDGNGNENDDTDDDGNNNGGNKKTIIIAVVIVVVIVIVIVGIIVIVVIKRRKRKEKSKNENSDEIQVEL